MGRPKDEGLRAETERELRAERRPSHFPPLVSFNACHEAESFVVHAPHGIYVHIQ